MNGHFAVMNVHLQAIDNGIFAEEIVPVEIPQRKGDPVIVDKMKHHDEIHHLKHWRNYDQHLAKTAQSQQEMHQV